MKKQPLCLHFTVYSLITCTLESTVNVIQNLVHIISRHHACMHTFTIRVAGSVSMEGIYVNVGMLGTPEESKTHHSLKALAERGESQGGLPCVLVVHQTNYGECDELLGDGQKLEVHFKRVTPVIVMKTTDKDYTVPINTSFLFSVLYNPNDDLAKARRGFTFETAAELMSVTPLPSAVHVGKECICSTGPDSTGGKRSIIPAGEVLIIEGMSTESYFGRLIKMLKCYMLEDTNGVISSKEVYLKENCEGQFSTQESLLLFPLSLILKYFKLPVTTSLYERESQSLHSRFKTKYALIQGSPLSLFSFIVTTPSTESTSYAMDALGSSSTDHLIEIYSTLKLSFHIKNTSNEEFVQMKHKMSSMYLTLSPRSITAVLYSTGLVDTLQSDLLSPINNDEWMNELKLPSFIKTLKRKKTPPVAPRPSASTILDARSRSALTKDKPPLLLERPKQTQEKNKVTKQDGSLPSKVNPLPTKPKPSSHSHPLSLLATQNVYEPLKYTPVKTLDANPAYEVVNVQELSKETGKTPTTPTSPQLSEKPSKYIYITAVVSHKGMLYCINKAV